MIHAHIDTVNHRQIVGFQVGTRAQFDAHHGGDPLWVFVDSYQVKYRANIKNFLRAPTTYKVDIHGNLLPSIDPPIIPVEELPNPITGYMALIGADGAYLRGADGVFLMGVDPSYAVPPAGQVYLIDPDGAFLTDPDADLLREAL